MTGPGDNWGLHSSFTAWLRAENPGVVEQRLGATEGRVVDAPQATTILAMRFGDGIVMAGDRRATEGMSIASRHIEKVFEADDHSVVAIAGAAGPAVEMIRLYQVELEHYEKIEGRRLSLDGKANRLAEMIRQNLPMALQGLAVIPIFAGYDLHHLTGRIYKYDLTGGRYEDRDFYATGSGGGHARSYIKARWHEDIDVDEAVSLGVEALFDAADEDAGTGGPDTMRGIYPTVAVVTGGGVRFVPDDEIAGMVERLVDELRARYTGTAATEPGE